MLPSSKSLLDAVRRGDMSEVKWLLRLGVGVNTRDSRNRTGLHIACQFERGLGQEIIEVLLRSKAEVNLQDNDGRTPLHEACSTWVQYVCLGYYCGELALHHPGHHSKVKDVNEGIELLLRSGAEVNLQDKHGKTPLHEAISKLDRQLQSLHYPPESIQQVSYIKPKDIPDVIDLLLRSGAKVNIQDNHGRTLLHEACEKKSEELVKALLRNGAKIGMVDKSSRTPLHEACCRNESLQPPEISIVKSLLYNGDKDLGSEERTTGCYPESGGIKYILNLQDCDGNTALHFASRANQEEVLCLLLRSGAKVGIKNKVGKTALHYAAGGGSADVVDVLLDNGENVNSKDCFGNTPLHLVSKSVEFFQPPINRVMIIENLLSKGAKIYEKNDGHETPYESLSKCIPGFSNSLYNVGFNGSSCNEIEKIEKIFIKHVIKLRSLTNQVRFDIKWKIKHPKFYEQSRSCCFELEEMKSTIILKDTSLYDVLSHTNHPYLLSTEDLSQVDEFLCSPDLLKRFPLYGHTLRAAFQRPKLLTLAAQSFYAEQRKKMVKELPFDVIEQLLAYLTNEDLRRFLKSE